MCIFAPPCKLCNTVMILIKMQTKDVPPVDLVPPLKGKSPCLNKLACICMYIYILISPFLSLCCVRHYIELLRLRLCSHDSIGQAGCVLFVCMHACLCLCLTTTLKFVIFTFTRFEKILRLIQQKIQGQVSISD